MDAFKYDHVHLRSPDPEETARYYEKMFGAEIIRSVQSDGRERIDLNLGGLTVFIAKVDVDKVGPPPEPPFQGLEHLGLTVHPIDEAVARKAPKSHASRRQYAPVCASHSSAARKTSISSCSTATRKIVSRVIPANARPTTAAMMTIACVEVHRSSHAAAAG